MIARRRWIGRTLAAVALTLGASLVPVAAQADPAAPEPVPAAPEPVPAAPEPGVDPGLVRAVERDLGMSWDEYVAQGERAAEVAAVQDAPGVEDVRVEDDRAVVVGEGPDAERAAAEVGAELERPTGASVEDILTAFTTEVDPALLVSVAPDDAGMVLQVTEETPAVTAFAQRWGVRVEQHEPLHRTELAGEYWATGAGTPRCSIGFGAFDAAGAPVLATAGHCTRDGSLATARLLRSGARGTLEFAQFGGPGNEPGVLGYDTAAYRLNAPGAIAPGAQTWDGTLPITGMADPVGGVSVCFGGGTARDWSCTANTRVGVAFVPGFGDNDGRLVRGLIMNGTTTFNGDSGTGVFMGTRVIGVLSGGAGEVSVASELTPLRDRGYTADVALEAPAAPRARPGTAVTGTLPRSAGAASVPGGAAVAVDTGRATALRRVSGGRFTFTAPSDPSAVVDLRARAGYSRGPAAQWNALVGTNTSGRFCGLRDGGCGQHFQTGSVYWATASGRPQVVLGAIRDGWATMGWERGWLGYPVSNERCGLVNGGCWQQFQGGRMYWSPASGTQAVRGAIGAEWNRLGYEWGRVGYPTSGEYCGLRDGGCFQTYQHGAMYWSPASGAHWVNGKIRERWASYGWETGRLGYPVTNENCGLRDGGCFNHFQNGTSIYWTPRTGAQPVFGKIRENWARQGWERGRWGYPTAPERCSTVGGFHCTQRFTGGLVSWDPVRGARLG